MNQQRLRIGISCYATFGGSGVVASEIGMAMARRGHKVHFISSDVPRRLDRFMENIYFHEVELRDYPVFISPPYAIGLASKMVEVATYEQLDILHVHYAVPHATSAYLAKQVLGTRAPRIITTLHGTDITLVGNDRSYLPITRFSIVQSDAVTAPSHYLKNATYDKLNVSSDLPIEVIPNFVDTNLYKPTTEAEAPNKDPRCFRAPTKGEKVLIHTSNFRPVKRLDDIVRIVAEVNKKIPARLILIGDGPERSRTEALVRDLKLGDKVCFLGKLESFVEILRQSDVFLLPSESESFGLAALEAMSCGLPVVATKIGGIPEVVTHGETGFLSDVGDIQEMSENVVRLLTNDGLRSEFSKRARAKVEASFGSEPMTNKYEDFYFRVMSKEPQPPSNGK